MAHLGDSTVQLEAEALIRAKVSEAIGVELAPARVAFDTGTPVDVDGVSADESVFVEMFARQGKLEGGQQKKVALDALKLITLARTRPGAKLILAFADHEAAAYALGKGWVADALKTWNVTVLIVE